VREKLLIVANAYAGERTTWFSVVPTACHGLDGSIIPLPPSPADSSTNVTGAASCDGSTIPLLPSQRKARQLTITDAR
jgi:hypothetical protein